LILPFLIATALSGGHAETPQGYIERLYAAYRNANFNPLAHPQLYFTPRLVAALDEDARLANGEVGYVDGDPVCQCQDPEGLHATVTRVTQKTPSKAEVRVSIGFTGYVAWPATFILLLTGAGWRIDDVSSADEPSLLRSIEDSNRARRSNH
jgi:Protein of unknown function (DUF3828)